MPSKISQRVAVADTRSTNSAPNRDRHHASGPAANEPDPDPKMSSRVAILSKATRNAPSSQQPLSRAPGLNQSDAAPKNGKQNPNSDGLLQIPDGTATRRPVETSIWDWDTPLDKVGESSSYYYEPQGELLQEQREQKPSRNEFSIPHAVAGSSMTGSIPGSGRGSTGNDGFVVPRRPSGVPAPTAGIKRKTTSDREQPGNNKEPSEKRMSRATSDAGVEPSSPSDGPPSGLSTRSQSGPALPNTRVHSTTDTSDSGLRPSTTDMEAVRAQGGANGPRRSLSDTSTAMVLPARKVFPIQIGDKLFRLSGASISSDAPSYFSQFFEEQLRQSEGADSVRTLYIDRDPATFEDISLHLQGYHIKPRDGTHFVKLFADAQFFSLPRLTAQLFASAIYIRIGDEEFQIPRDLFSNPGDSPNYFTLGFAVFFTSPTEVFPGLSQRTLLRPPSLLPPSVPNRSAKTFADLLHILKGYPVEIRNEQHRQELLRDARYFHLKGLEQRLIPHEISYNLARRTSEICVRLEDIRQSGISFVTDHAASNSEAPSPSSSTVSSPPNTPGWVYYQRPYVDSEAYCLIVEVNAEEATFLSIAPSSSTCTARVGRATFHRQTLSRITSLFSVISNKMNLPVTQPLGLMMMERGAGVASLPVSPGNTGVSDEKVKVRIGPDAGVTVDGKKWLVGENYEGDDEAESEMDVDRSESARPARRKRRSGDGDEENEEEDAAAAAESEGEEWIVRKAQWRLRVQPLSAGWQSGGRSGMEVVLGAVKIIAFRGESGRNASRDFLS